MNSDLTITDVAAPPKLIRATVSMALLVADPLCLNAEVNELKVVEFSKAEGVID